MGSLSAINSNSVLHFYSGSFCNLYKTNNNIVIKSIRHAHINNTLVLNRFKNEMSLLKNLTLNHIPSLLSYDIQSPTPYFAYEYIKSISVGSYINDTAKSSLRSEQILLTLLTILAKFNDAGLIHSDITPDNILINDDFQVHIIDFGSADIPLNNELTTSTWISKYTYCSPEQAQGNHWSFQSDIYQSGLLFYELLTGERFNKGISRQALALAANPKKANYHNIDRKYHSILDNLLEPQSKKRCSNAHEALALLDVI